MGTKLFWRVSSIAYPRGNSPQYLWTAGWAGFSVGLNAVRKRKTSCSPLHRSSSSLVVNSLAQLLYRLSCSDSSILTIIWHILPCDDAKYRSCYRISILWKIVCRPCGEKDGSQIYTWSPKQSFVRSPVTIWQQYHWQTGLEGGGVLGEGRRVVLPVSWDFEIFPETAALLLYLRTRFFYLFALYGKSAGLESPISPSMEGRRWRRKIHNEEIG